MDSNQVSVGNKRSKKKKKPTSFASEAPKVDDIKSYALQHTESSLPLTSSGEAIIQPKLLPPARSPQKLEEQGPVSSQVYPEDLEGKSSKRKRNRKKKVNKQVGEGVDCGPAKSCGKLVSGSEANISASFLPIVEEANQLVEVSKGPMSSEATGISLTTSNSTAKKQTKKLVDVSNNIEKIISPGAQLLALELETSDSSPTHVSASSTLGCPTGVFKATTSHENVTNSLDLHLLNCAANIGPIYSRSSLCSSVTVTCSSSSSQLSIDRTQNLHLYGNNLHPSSSETSANLLRTPSDIMSAPSAVPKSREEVEAERKARKAAKAASKGKSKVNLEKSGKPEKNVEGPIGKTEESPKVEPIVTIAKDEGQKSSEERLAESVKNLDICGTGKKISKNRAADVPDFAVAHSPHRHEDFIPASLLETLTKQAAEKSKAELRAERRAKQEAQRAAKVQQQAEKQKAPQPVLQQKSHLSAKSDKITASVIKDPVKRSTASKPLKEVKDVKADRRVKLFSHLYQNSFKKISQTIGVSHPEYHSAIVRLGVQYANRVVLGSNARCLALLYALKDVIASYETPPEKEFSRGLEAYLQPNMDLLQQCRPHSVSMVNALRHIKWQLTQLPIGEKDTEAKQHILDAIDQYINDQIGKAAEAIGKVVKDKIDDNDVILVYACSSLVLSALKVALEEKRKFHVIVVDSLPWLEGREMLRRLVAMGVQCSYVHLSAASFVMRQVSKVLLGAHALLANGYVMSRAGSSQVALMAHAYNVPVLVCCETHKFSERVQTDSFVYNELADPDELIGLRRAGDRETEKERPLSNWRDIPSLSLLNLVYDVTPPDLVTAVVTERAILPCTSVPVILRMKPTEC